MNPKKLAYRLPRRWRQSLKRLHFRRQIRRSRFTTPEPEFVQLQSFLSPGDWAIDIGANVGRYTRRMSQLVGPGGRVVAFEPVPETFELLASNVASLENVTLVNAAASDQVGVAQMGIPGNNYYRASLKGAGRNVTTLCLMVDSLTLPSVAFVKIDVEGHELSVLKGMDRLIEGHRPTIVMEENAEGTAYLRSLGYKRTHNEGSPNSIFRAG